LLSGCCYRCSSSALEVKVDREDRAVLSIGEVAAAAGVRPSALRYYEEVGLIAPRERRGGRRYYDPDVLSRLAFIALCQDAGFTIAEIATLLEGRLDARRRWRRLAEAKLDDIGRQMDQLREMRRLLEAALACGCGSVETCDLVDAAAHRRRALHHAAPRR
jgi:MerR family transcriptional regulator, redox-sensitive transcriptional activator SoxR